MFAIGGWQGTKGAGEPPDLLGVTFKASPTVFEILRDQSGLRPAPYLASRGFKWIQRTGEETMSEEDLCDYLREIIVSWGQRSANSDTVNWGFWYNIRSGSHRPVYSHSRLRRAQ